MTVDKYSSVRRDSQARGRVADGERGDLRYGLTHLIRTINAAKTGRIMEPGKPPVTYDEARATYFDLVRTQRTIHALSFEEVFESFRGALRIFPETQRPLLIRDIEDAGRLTERYGFDPISYGRDAVTILHGIASGELRGGAGLREEPTPVRAVVRILRDTFEPETARDIVIGAIEARQDRIVRRPENVRQDRNALAQAVSELSSFSGEQVVEALSGVMKFAGKRKDSDLLTASALSLRKFAEDPDNREAVESKMNALRMLFHDLPDGEVGKKLLAEVFQGFAGRPIRGVI